MKIKYDKQELREFGFGILEQNLTEEQLPYYVAAHYKAKCEGNSIIILLSVITNIVLMMVVLILFWVLYLTL